MGEELTITASDGHRLGAYRVSPRNTPRGGIIVIQEIFGVNVHIRNVADSFAAEGYETIAPALYDRSSKKNVQLDYELEDIEFGRQLRDEFSWDDSIKDIEAVKKLLLQSNQHVGLVGYCWGGTIAFLSALRLALDAVVVYYGSQVLPYVGEIIRCPILLHFGEQDVSMPLEYVDKIRNAHPEAHIYIYKADHGFNCNERAQYDEVSAHLSRRRTLDFFSDHLG